MNGREGSKAAQTRQDTAGAGPELSPEPGDLQPEERHTRVPPLGTLRK